MRPSIPVLFLFLGLFATAGAQDPKSGLGTLAELPPHLRFEEGKINLVVDYAAETGQIVPLYIVNTTDVPKPFLKHPWIIRETLGVDGQWRRSNPVTPPECAFGLLDKVEIPPSGFYKTDGWLNSENGERRTVRFREYIGKDGGSGSVSNEGFGVVDPEEVDACRFDFIGLPIAPFEDVALVALQQVPLRARRESDRKMALVRLVMWQAEPRRIDVLKGVITKAKAQNDREAYSLALWGLSITSPPDWTEDAYWRFVVAEINSGQPLSSVAFDRVMEARSFPERKEGLLDQIIANPRHSNLAGAIRVYPEIAGKAATKKMAQRVSRSSKYPESARTAAREIIAKLQPAP